MQEPGKRYFHETELHPVEILAHQQLLMIISDQLAEVISLLNKSPSIDSSRVMFRGKEEEKKKKEEEKKKEEKRSSISGFFSNKK